MARLGLTTQLRTPWLCKNVKRGIETTLEVPPRPAALGRRASSGSVRSYGVTTIGRGVDVEEDEDGGY